VVKSVYHKEHKDFFAANKNQIYNGGRFVRIRKRNAANKKPGIVAGLSVVN